MHPNALLDLTARLVHEVLKLDAPADSIVSYFFRSHKELGQRERHALAETAYAVLRQRLLWANLAQSGHGPMDRRLAILAWQGEPHVLKKAMTVDEATWVTRTQAVDRHAMPDKLRHNLPDWLSNSLRAQLSDEEFWALVDTFSAGAPLDLRVNAVKAKREAVIEALAAANIAAEPTPYSPIGIRIQGKPALQKLPLYTGGDGTQRGGNELFQEARRRGHPLAVVGIPKTIDNDVAFVSRTFGYLTAVEQAAHALSCAHTEAHSVRNGISIVKLMGRSAGFIAAGATLASQDVNFCLIPEIPFRLDGPCGLLAALKKRVLARNHALIVVAEGAGQDLLAGTGGTDASGNAKLKDIGPFLREQIEAYFKAEKTEATIRYIDPSYLVRSVPADAEDAILCDQFARHAVHAAMAGKTGLVIGQMHDEFVHVPIELLATQTKRVDPESALWRSALAATGQPARFE